MKKYCVTKGCCSARIRRRHAPGTRVALAVRQCVVSSLLIFFRSCQHAASFGLVASLLLAGVTVLLLPRVSLAANMEKTHAPGKTASGISGRRQCVIPALDDAVLLPDNVRCWSTESMRKAQRWSDWDEELFALTTFFRGKREGFFVEVGAFDGVSHSITLMFERYFDWSGLLIEGDADNFAKLRLNRPRAFRYHGAVCNTSAPIHWAGGHGAEGGIYEFLSHYFIRNRLFHANISAMPVVQCNSMRSILASPPLAHVAHIDLLVLDVEGAELEALASFPFDRVTVSVFCIDWDATHSDNQKPIRNLLAAKGYRFYDVAAKSAWFVKCGFRGYICPTFEQ